MGFGRETLDVYRAAIENVGWAYRSCETLKGHRHAKDWLLRASQAIPLNMAEGHGKATPGDGPAESSAGTGDERGGTVEQLCHSNPRSRYAVANPM